LISLFICKEFLKKVNSIDGYIVKCGENEYRVRVVATPDLKALLAAISIGGPEVREFHALGTKTMFNFVFLTSSRPTLSKGELRSPG
jgi:hypothetical protein